VVCWPSGRRALILLLVEGPSDKEALPILAAKMAPDSPVPKALVVGKGDLFKPSKLKVHINFARQRDPTISKVLPCVDSECIPVEETRRRVTPLETKLQRSFRHLTVRYVVVDHSLEGWLLCDREAVRRALGNKARLPRYESPEDDCRPVELLNRIFRRNKREFIKTRDAHRLAEEAKPQRISKASNTFRDFQQAVRDP